MDPLSRYDGETVLITGDTGFKGSWLATWLVQRRARVIGFGLPPKDPNDNYCVCDLENVFKHINGDIRDINALGEVIGKYRPSVIFHLAAQALVLEAIADPRHTFETNIMGTVNILEAARLGRNTKAIVNITSDKCYENMEWSYGYRENDRVGGKDPYSASKGAAEIISSSYARTYFGTKEAPRLATARAGNVIGGGDWSPNRIVPDCIRAIRDGNRIQIRNPESVRPWQHVLDPLYGYLLLGSNLMHGDRLFDGAWNFGPAQRGMIPVRRLVDAIIRHWGAGECCVADSHGGLEAKYLHLDISKAINELGWNPMIDFEQAVQKTVEEYKIDGLSKEEVYRQRIGHIEEYQNLVNHQREGQNG